MRRYELGGREKSRKLLTFKTRRDIEKLIKKKKTWDFRNDDGLRLRKKNGVRVRVGN